MPIGNLIDKHANLCSNSQKFISNSYGRYLPVVMFCVLYFGSRLYHKIKGKDDHPVNVMKMDFFSGSEDCNRDFSEHVTKGTSKSVLGKIKSIF
ncbi:hypothetical protein CROQUDRAFT_309425 [Cronartium quercuum f. sp. fusiforme G11]|uniref:Uncharacterized protein n=1 Tax=Cronartium quercuum f. sp. fusiforme G11 TaxID=708437 RepID=A0A9P6T6Z2_9BASI|nr:hypothetical protein CROQUDRAFT_309425 [Cronartium quercuum f. sp. fusiforme G11]